MIQIYAERRLRRARMLFAAMMVAGALAFLLLLLPASRTITHYGISPNAAVELPHHHHQVNHPQPVRVHRNTEQAAPFTQSPVDVGLPVTGESTQTPANGPQGGSHSISGHNPRHSPASPSTPSKPSEVGETAPENSSPPPSEAQAESRSSVVVEATTPAEPTTNTPEQPLTASVEHLVEPVGGVVKATTATAQELAGNLLAER